MGEKAVKQMLFFSIRRHTWQMWGNNNDNNLFHRIAEWDWTKMLPGRRKLGKDSEVARK